MRERTRGAQGRVFFASLILLATAGCNSESDENSAPAPAPVLTKGASPTSGQPAPKYVTLTQNWSTEERQQFYFTSQGSQILPYDWFLVLEQADSQTLFRDDANMLKLGYLLEDKNAKWNPDGLPVGFVKDDGRRRNWLGFNCAACHTSQIDFNGVSYRIDGGATLADVHGFLSGVTDALKATRDKEDKFLRFSGRILGTKGNPTDRDTLKADLTEIINQREGYNARNFPANALPLPGRVDAFGAILNEVYHHIVKPPVASNTTNTAPADAPVSYPFLWDTPQHDFVQWNGAASNAGVGSLGRNVGEVLGVFGKFEIPEHPGVSGYSSSVKVRNLLEIEDWLKKLWSPQWPAALGAIKPELRDAGRKAFEKANCNNCHKEIDRTDKFRRIEAKMQAVGTEDRMAVNFTKRFGKTGVLEGAFLKVVGTKLLGSPQFTAQAGGEDVLSHVVIGTILGSPYPAPEDELTLIDYRRKKAAILKAAIPGMGGGGTYKARPLNGIWATAPYLHNGSVPTLYHLLLPAKDRPKSFTIGSREFDPKNVGFRTDAPGFPVYQARTDDGKAVAGNSNDGHEFGSAAQLSDDERWALVEYLKSL